MTNTLESWGQMRARHENERRALIFEAIRRGGNIPEAAKMLDTAYHTIDGFLRRNHLTVEDANASE